MSPTFADSIHSGQPDDRKVRFGPNVVARAPQCKSSAKRARASCYRKEIEEGSVTKEQQLDVLSGLDAVLLEVLFDQLAARDGSALLGGRGAAHCDGAHGLARYARQRRAPRMLAARRRAQVAPRTRERAHACSLPRGRAQRQLRPNAAESRPTRRRGSRRELEMAPRRVPANE